MRQLKISKTNENIDETIESCAEIQDVSEFTIMKHIESIVELTKDSKLSDDVIKECVPHTKLLEEILNLTQMQIILLAVFIDQSQDESIRMTDLSRHFDCRNVSLFCYSDDIDELCSKGYIRKKNPSNYQRVITYKIPNEVLDALKKNKPYTVPSVQGLTIQKFFDHLFILFEETSEKELSTEDLFVNIDDLLDGNSHLAICKGINKYCLENPDITLLLLFCHKFVNENDDNIVFYDIERIFDSKAEFNSIRSEFTKGDHTLLITKAIVPRKDSELASRDCYCLSDNAKLELLSELKIELSVQQKPNDIIYIADIITKQLFYNYREQQQIEQLTSFLQDENFKNVQERLIQSGMRRGFACLFYGAPGTGKTETAYQIARQVGRDILIVNVSNIKSMWVGESEKNIKAVFDRYRNLCKSSTLTPILLFNEADAILGIRHEGAERAVDKMENAIQNIILQEMENLEGIMIATTNLTNNLDKAFERRFLYKIEFDKPSIEAKKSIWKTMLSEINEEEVSELARVYDFSGGQIENVSRKYLIEKVVFGKIPSLNEIKNICDVEILDKKSGTNKLGFKPIST